MSKIHLALAGMAAVAVAVLATARGSADIPPVPDWDDMSCIAKAQTLKGETCRDCRVVWNDAGRCARELGAEGMARRCRSAGIKAWTEVWCRQGEALASSASASSTAVVPASASAPASAAPSAAPAPGRSGCAMEPGASDTLSETGLWMLAALRILCRR